MNSRISNPSFLLPIVLIGLVGGISGGWIRLGSPIIPLAEAGLNHGLLMVGGFLGLFFIGLIVPFHGLGNEVLGLAVLLISVWLLVFDMAKVAAKKEAQFRYIGVGLRVGYLWLGAQGLILLLMESHPLFYDLVLQTFFLGFAFSMIWAHAPIIFPTIFGIRETPYHPILWITWAGFQLSLLGRILASVLGEFELRKIFGVANGYLILIQFILMAGVVRWKIQHSKKFSLKSNSDFQTEAKVQSFCSPVNKT